MHPAYISWFKHARRHFRDARDHADAHFGGGGGGGGGGGDGFGPGGPGGPGGFGPGGPGGFGPGGPGGPEGPGGFGGDGFGRGRGGWRGEGRGHGGHGHHGPPEHGHGRFGHGEDGGFFGVRRPLRFLAHKLELSEAQVAELARILDELKTERAQGEVDLRRTVTAFADAVEGAAFGEARAREGGEMRVKSAERLRDAVTLALSRIHAMLEDEQRKRLSYLIRTGVVTL